MLGPSKQTNKDIKDEVVVWSGHVIFFNILLRLQHKLHV